jgi:hypothetical protein
MEGLKFFAVLAGAGCTFLIYFVFALLRDLRTHRRGLQVEAIRPRSKSGEGKLLHLHSSRELYIQEEKTG